MSHLAFPVLSCWATEELIRRGLWATIRIEHEHQSNAGRFRSVCWVPPLDHRRPSFNGKTSKRKPLIVALVNSDDGPMLRLGFWYLDASDLLTSFDMVLYGVQCFSLFFKWSFCLWHGVPCGWRFGSNMSTSSVDIHVRLESAKALGKASAHHRCVLAFPEQNHSYHDVRHLVAQILMAVWMR